MAAEGVLSDMYFGFDADRLALRLDARGGPFRERLAEMDALKLVFYQPEKFELLVSHLDRKNPTVALTHNGVSVAHSGVKVAAESIFEMTVPLGSLAVATDDPMHFFVQLIKDGQPVERVPGEGAIETTVPSADYELVMWQA